jgi:lipoprotein-anchoring transpeptidase ErfK/SrfK
VAVAQFAPGPAPVRTLPPVSDDDRNLPPYDPPPGYRQGPPRTYDNESLPAPGPYGQGGPGYGEPVYASPPSPPPGGYREPVYASPPTGGVYREPPPGYEPMPQAPAGRPQYGAAPSSRDDGFRPPAGIGPGQGGPGQRHAAIDPETISRLPQDDQPETGPRKELPPHLRRQQVNYNTREPAGTIIVDTQNTYLYLVLGGGKAMRYGIGVGREGFTWQGSERVTRMAEWPDWHPPAEMIERQPYLPRFMAGGEGNPMGARALYLGKTIYRIHGTNQPSTIGTFVSSGCIRLTNEDVTDLYYRVKVGSRVVVLPGKPPATASVAPTPGPGVSNAPPVPQAQYQQPQYQQPQYQQPQYPQAESYGGEPIPLQPPGVIQAR